MTDFLSFSNEKYSFVCQAHIAFSIRSVMQKLICDDLINMGKIIPQKWITLERIMCNFISLKVVTNEKGEAVGEVLTIIC